MHPENYALGTNNYKNSYPIVNAAIYRLRGRAHHPSLVLQAHVLYWMTMVFARSIVECVQSTRCLPRGRNDL